MTVLFAHGECPERLSARKNARGDTCRVGRVLGVDESVDEDFVDGSQGGFDVFFLFFHIVDDVFEVFSFEVRAPGDAAA